MQNTKYSVADIFRQYGKSFLKEQRVSSHHLKVIDSIIKCKTFMLGGHIEKCNKCGHKRIHYNSCGNRHCPSCQGANKEKWILDRSHEVLPVKYFHVTFTVPDTLHDLFRYNKKILYNLLFTCVWKTLDDFSKTPDKKLMAKMGVIAVLHTWTQKILYHPHIHCIVPAGGITSNDKWKHSQTKGNFLFNKEALAAAFRGKFLFYLDKLYKQYKLNLNGKNQILKNPYKFQKLKDNLYSKQWIVNVKKPFAGPEQVLEYLGRYTHRIAISNYRILNLINGMVTFSYIDRKNGNKIDTTTISAIEFIRRFLEHVLPPKFVKVRHYGFLASRVKSDYLRKIREYFNLDTTQKKQKLSFQQIIYLKTGKDPYLCPLCNKGLMEIIEQIPPVRGSPRKRIITQRELIA